MEHINPLEEIVKCKKNAAAEITHTAADRTIEIRDAVAEKILPLVEQAQDALGPLARDAKVKSATFAANAMDKAQPAINDALDKMTPAVDAARHKMQKEVLPNLNRALKAAAELPGESFDKLPKADLKKMNRKMRKQAKKLAKQSDRRSKDIVRALRGELEPKRNRTGKVVGVVAIVSALLGTAAILLRRYLNQADESGWAAHEPSPAYVNNDAENTTENTFGENDVKPTTDPGASGDTVDVEHVADVDHEDVPDVEAAPTGMDTDTEEPRPFSDAAAAEGAGSETAGYGEGSYVGDNPPEGFVIKGNQRSMKYHMEGNSGFERTIPDVWFNSEEAAQAAGVVKAQR